MELKILDALQMLHTPILDGIMCGITKLGNAGVVWILLAAVLLLVLKTRKSGVVLTVALCMDRILCNGLLKNLVARVRPCEVNRVVQVVEQRRNVMA